jgi:peptidoglycan/LPS O-acetylase OafA/YrhL
VATFGFVVPKSTKGESRNVPVFPILPDLREEWLTCHLEGWEPGSQNSRRCDHGGRSSVGNSGQSSGNVTSPLTIGEAFQPRRNSLNFLRLVFAIAVMFSHSLTIGSFGSEVILGKTTLGTLAVYCFFCLSGYLIAGSATRNHVGRFLWQRVLRIFPAFWVCIIVTAFLFGPIGWYHMQPVLARNCGISCYLSESGGPFSYVFHNLWLQGHQGTIANTLHPGLFQDIWNGSLWTLFFEFLCYLMLAVLSVVGLLRHRLAIVALASVVWLTEIVITAIPSLNQHFNPSHNWDVMKMLTFVPIFLAGSLLYLYRDKIPDSGVLAAASTLLALLGLALPVGNHIPAFSLTSMDLTAVFLAYPLLWLGIHLPFHKVGARNDYSYGVYVYAFPVQQVLDSGSQSLGLLALQPSLRSRRGPVCSGELVAHRETCPTAQDPRRQVPRCSALGMASPEVA